LPDEHNAIFEVRNDKAIAGGLTFRPLRETVADTLRWDLTREQTAPMRAGLTQERERNLLLIATGVPG
jgi:2'-hydroxyisoflavone reductase